MLSYRSPGKPSAQLATCKEQDGTCAESESATDKKLNPEWEELKRKHEASFIEKWEELKKLFGFTPRAMQEMHDWAEKQLGTDADKRLWHIFTTNLALYASYLHTY